jgi:hypothetical protein
VFLFVPLIATGVARVASEGFHYHGVGLGVARGDDSDVSGLVDDLRLADVRVVFCGRYLDVVVVWHKPTHQKQALFVAKGRVLHTSLSRVRHAHGGGFAGSEV